jgi:hypothetical protein
MDTNDDAAETLRFETLGEESEDDDEEEEEEPAAGSDPYCYY